MAADQPRRPRFPLRPPAPVHQVEPESTSESEARALALVQQLASRQAPLAASIDRPGEHARAQLAAVLWTLGILVFLGINAVFVWNGLQFRNTQVAQFEEARKDRAAETAREQRSDRLHDRNYRRVQDQLDRLERALKKGHPEWFTGGVATD